MFMRTNKLIPFILCGCFVSERPIIFNGYKRQTYWIREESHTRNKFSYIFYGNTLNQGRKKSNEESFFIISINAIVKTGPWRSAFILYLMRKRFSWIPNILSALDACWRLYSFQGYFQSLNYVFFALSTKVLSLKQEWTMVENTVLLQTLNNNHHI